MRIRVYVKGKERLSVDMDDAKPDIHHRLINRGFDLAKVTCDSVTVVFIDHIKGTQG